MYILQKRNAAVFHNVCPQLLFVLGTIERYVEDLGPIPLNYDLRYTSYKKNPIAFCREMYIIIGLLLIGDFEKSKSV